MMRKRCYLPLAAAFCILLSAAAYAAQPDGTRTPPVIKNAQEKPDFNRLPRFYTSDSAYDEFLNEYFIRYLSVDERGVYWKQNIMPGLVDHLWVVEWDSVFLPWVDRGAMGLERQNGTDTDVMVMGILNVPVDKYGYVYGAMLRPEANNSIGGYAPMFGWPWPKYNWNSTVQRPTG